MGSTPSERRWTRFRDLLPLQERNSFLAARSLAARNVDILSPPLENHAVQQLVQLSPHRIPLQDITPPPPPHASVPAVPTTLVKPQSRNDEQEWQITSICLSPSNSLCSTLEGGDARMMGTNEMRQALINVPVYKYQEVQKEDTREEDENDVFYSPPPLPKTPSLHPPTPKSLLLRTRHSENGATPLSQKSEWTYEKIQSCTSLSRLIPLEAALSTSPDFPGLLRAVQTRIELLRRPHSPSPGINPAIVEDASSQSSSLVMSISTTTTIELLAVNTASRQCGKKSENVFLGPSPERRSLKIQKQSLTPYHRKEQKQGQKSTTHQEGIGAHKYAMVSHDARPLLHRDYLVGMEERIQEFMHQNLSLRQQIHTVQVQLQRIQADRSLLIQTIQSMLPPTSDKESKDGTHDNLYRLLAECKGQWMRQQQHIVQIQNELHQSEQAQRAAFAAKDKSEHLYIQATRDLRRLQQEQKSLLEQVQQLQRQESRKMAEHREREQQYQRIIAEMKDQLSMAAGGENRVPMNLYRAAIKEAHQYRQELQSLLMLRMNHVWPTTMGPWPSVQPMARPKTPAASKKHLRTLDNEPSPATNTGHWSNSFKEENEKEFRTSPLDSARRDPAPTKSVHWNSPELKVASNLPVSTPYHWKRHHQTATPVASKTTSEVPTTGDTASTPVSSLKKVTEPTSSDAKENNRSQLRFSLVRAAGGRRGLQQTLRQIRSPHPQKEKSDHKDEPAVKAKQSSYQEKLDRMRIRPRPLQEIQS